nr:LytTR family DNA-binding domain-containing protein [uncultured Blautia sp.]
MISIAICDDDKYIVQEIEELILSISQEKRIKVDVEPYYDGSFLERDIRNGTYYDLIYLDIEMKHNGLLTAKNIRLLEIDAVIIYVSNYEKYLKELFEVEAFRFLNKPINVDKFEKYFLKAINKIDKNTSYFVYRFNREYYKVKVNEIVYFESKKRNINIFCTDESILTYYGKLSEVEQHFCDEKIPFIRTHQSFLVNYEFIHGFKTTYIEMKDGKKIPISEDRFKKVKQQYGQLIGKDLFDV